MKKEQIVPTPPETGVENPVFSVIGGERFRLDLNDNGAEAAVVIALATTVCCVCGGGNAVVRLGIEVVNRLLK